MNTIELIAGWIIGVLLAFCVIFLLIVTPAMLVADKRCLEAGYPNSHVTYTFDVYCERLDGQVTNTIKLVK